MIVTIVIIVVIAILVVFAVRKAIKTFTGKGGGCHGSDNTTAKRVKVSDKDESHYPYVEDFNIEGMSCDACASNVESAINALGDIWARVSWENGTAHVLAKQPIQQDVIESAVSDAGYYLART